MNESKPLKLRCPRCRRPTAWEDNPNRPFCSEKCRLIDLGCWADEEYRIPGERVDPEDHAQVIEFPKENNR
jgi:endogenous inhibitor of DNA gyrase (YacG/DUF329 family)